MILIQDELCRVVENVRKQLGFDNITFQYSTMTEFIQLLTTIKDGNKKYPFFFVHSIGVDYDNSNFDTIVTISDILIAGDSKAKWTREERDDETFKPILNPIYNTFLDKLRRDRNVEIVKRGNITNHYFYGDTGVEGYDGAKFPDHVDVIQLKNFQFRLLKQYCNK